LTLIIYARKLQIKVYNTVQRYTVLMHTIMSYYEKLRFSSQH
jgi:hypothetical protein